jgi:Ribbon-helix-helix protein, copG family
MEDTELKTMSFKVTGEEQEAIDRHARENGLSRSDFIRQRLSTEQSARATGNSQPSKDITVLLEHIVYGLHAVHAAVYAIAETTGTITAAQSDRILNGSLKASRDHLAHLDERITAVRQQIKPAEAEVQIKKAAQEIKADGLSRSI